MKRKRRFSVRRSLLSALLAVAMVFGNVSGALGTAWAAQTETVEFEIQGSDLVNAIREAIENDLPVTKDDLDFTDGAIDKFESVFFETGKVYEIYPLMDGGNPEGDVRLFVRVPEDATEDYELTGDEEIIFLYINSGEETLSFTTSVRRTVANGSEKVKKTGKVSVKAYEAVFGDGSAASSKATTQMQTKEQVTAGEAQNKE